MPLISERFLNDGKAVLELSELQKKHIAIFEEKCRSGEYTFRQRTCECGSTDFELIAQKDRYGIGMDTVICRNCGLIITNPCLDDKSNTKFYDRDYQYIYRAEEKPSEEVFLAWRREADLIVEFVRKHTGMYEGSVLEIGCADGRNVIAFAEAGYDASGIDLSHDYVEFGRKKGLDLYCTDVASFQNGGKKYDIIVLNHVLEHFTDPGKELFVIKKLLKPEGFLYIGVPGVKALTFGAYQGDFLRMLQNAHIFNFTKDTLCRTMARYGFSCVFCNEGVYGVFRKADSDEYAGNSYEDIRRYLDRVEKAAGNIALLRRDRINEIVTKYGKGEVVLYGALAELDDIVQNIEDTSSILGFFYSDKKTPEKVMDYLWAQAGAVKCIIIANAERNDYLSERFWQLNKAGNIDIYSAYGELF